MPQQDLDRSLARLAMDDAGGLLLMPTLRLCEVRIFEIRLLGCDDDLKIDD